MGKFYIRCLFTGFLDFPSPRKNGKSEYLKIRLFGFSGISEIRFPELRISGNLKIRIFRFPEFRISENPDFRKSENPDFPISGASDVEFSEASDAGHRRCPDPSKKHGDCTEVTWSDMKVDDNYVLRSECCKESGFVALTF